MQHHGQLRVGFAGETTSLAHNNMYSINIGRITNLETQEMRFKRWEGVMAPDNSLWRECNLEDTYFLFVLRIFYIKGPSVAEQLGIQVIFFFFGSTALGILKKL